MANPIALAAAPKQLVATSKQVTERVRARCTMHFAVDAKGHVAVDTKGNVIARPRK